MKKMNYVYLEIKIGYGTYMGKTIYLPSLLYNKSINMNVTEHSNFNTTSK